MLPGYLGMPSAMASHDTLRAYVEAETPETGWWHNLPAYLVSLLKAWYGDNALPENEFGYHNLPLIDSDLPGADDARHRRRRNQGLLVFSQNHRRQAQHELVRRA
jgi:hypothetical protein